RYVGLDVHAAARVMAAGHGGQVLVSESTRALLDDRFQLRDLGEHRLKDLSGAQRLYQLQVEGLLSDFPPLKTLENRPTNLPVEPVLETLTQCLRGRRMRLGLDNFEHVLAAAPAVSGLLASAQELAVLVTSRTPLRISGERTYAVPPLDPSESVSLFAERAQA